MRIGFGYDVHRLITGRKLVLGGMEIPFEKGLLGHSDADVLCHAIGDALLGAAALGDLGTHFPDSDERYKDISSLKILEDIHQILKDNKFQIIYVDSTVVLERPKIASLIATMRKNISESLSIEVVQISVKVTTTEGLGFTGLGEGVASYAVAIIQEI